jgi:hypothetical protein
LGLGVVATERFLEGWVEREVPPAELFVDDRPNLEIRSVHGELALLQTVFKGKAHADRPLPTVRHLDPWADVAPHIVVALVLLITSVVSRKWAIILMF